MIVCASELVCLVGVGKEGSYRNTANHDFSFSLSRYCNVFYITSAFTLRQLTIMNNNESPDHHYHYHYHYQYYYDYHKPESTLAASD